MKASVASIIIVSFLLPAAANARDVQSNGLNWMGEVSVAAGGDKLTTLHFTDGSSQNINAGNGLTISAGVLQHFSASFGIKYAIGWKGSWSAAENLDVQKSAIPIDLVPFYQSGKHRIGAGLTFHMSPKLYVETLGTSRFDNANGYIAEYSFAGFTLAYTGIKYTIDNVKFDASNIGFRYTYEF